MTREQLIKYANMVAEKSSPMAWKKLRNCKAEYLQYYDICILRSYNTIVAIEDLHYCTVYVFDYYSNTTCQHVRKFCDEMHAYNLVKLYKDSRGYLDEDLDDFRYSYRPNARNWKTIISQDFVNVLLDHFTDDQFRRYCK